MIFTDERLGVFAPWLVSLIPGVVGAGKWAAGTLIEQSQQRKIRAAIEARERTAAPFPVVPVAAGFGLLAVLLLLKKKRKK
jgi:hypothetical protein